MCVRAHTFGTRQARSPGSRETQRDATPGSPKSGQNWSGQFKSGQLRSGQPRSGESKSDQGGDTFTVGSDSGDWMVGREWWNGGT